MADRKVTADIVAQDKTARGINSAAKGFDRLNRKVQQTGDRWAREGDNAGKRFAGRMIAATSKLVGAGVKIGSKFSDAMGSGLKSGGPYLTAILVAAVAAAAPIAAAALVSGILLALGGGFLAAGIASAMDSPKVQKAWQRFGDRAKTAFETAFSGTDFNQPLIRAADTFGDALERIGSKVKESGLSGTFARIVDRLAPALAAMAENALPGILRSIEASAPYFDKLAEHAPAIGRAISKFFDKIADAGPGAELFFTRFLQAIEVLLPVIGSVIAWLSNLFLRVDRGIQSAIIFFTRFGRRVLDIFASILGGAAAALSWVPGLGPKLDAAAAKFKVFRDKANAYLAGIEDEIVNVDVRIRERRIRDAKGGAGSQFGHQEFSAGSSFIRAMADPAGGGGRAGGPAPVDVTSEVNVFLDGEPFAARIATAIRSNDWRARWRRRQMRTV